MHQQGRISLLTFALFPLVLQPACSVHYHDARTGVDHLWGLGHLKVKAGQSPEGVPLLLNGVQQAGLSVGHGPGQTHLSLGYSNHQRITLDDQTNLTLVFPSGGIWHMQSKTN